MKKSVVTILVALAILITACAPASAQSAQLPVTGNEPVPMNATEPASPTATNGSMPTETAEPQTIVDIAVADGRFTTLVAAVQAAGLVETLQGPGPFTVFAPTDEAFAKLPEGTLEALLQDPAALKNILLYHVASGRLAASDVAAMTSLETLQGSSVTIKVDGEKVFVNDAQVIITDIQASNGVIHVIDSVLIPPQ